MANEIQLTTTMIVTNGYFKWTFQPGTIQITQAALGGHASIVSVGTAEEDMTFGDVVTPGLICLRNTDTTNFVTYGPKSGGSMILFGKLKPGESTVLRLGASVTWRWKADTAACKVEIVCLED